MAPRSEAGKLRFPVGSVIQTAFGRPVTTPEQFKAAVDAARAAGRPSILLRVRTPGQSQSILLALELSKAE